MKKHLFLLLACVACALPALAPAPFKGYKVSGGKLRITLPAASIVVLAL